MGGGLIQIVSYGSEDITLTGNPEITFFSIVYRRYTNFGIRNVILDFDNSVEFNNTSYLNIPKNSGDLINNMILKIELPKINFDALNENNSSKNIDDKYYVYYNYYVNFYNKLKNLVDIFFNEYKNLNVKLSYINDLDTFIRNRTSVDEFYQFFLAINFFYNYNNFTDIKYNLQNYQNASLYKINNETLIYIYRNFSINEINFNQFKNLIYKNIETLYYLNQILYDKLVNITITNSLIKGCWVNKIGIYIINSIELFIGSIKIDTLTDNYINRYGNLNYQNKGLYDEMIGNNQEINKYKTNHDSQNLYLPLPFWFFNNYGLSFPLIALQYNSIQLKINTKKFIECIKIDLGENYNNDKLREDILVNLTNNLNNILLTNIKFNLIVDYIYLDSIERKKFAQSAHEYLITQVQQLEFNNLTLSKNSFELDFYHCCKDLYCSLVKNFNINDIFDNNIDYYSYNINNINYYRDENFITYINYLKMLNIPTDNFDLELFINGIYVISKNYQNISLFDEIQNKTKFNIMNNINNFIKKELVESISLTINGIVLINQKSTFFNCLQPYIYYNAYPGNDEYVYSFCLNPTVFQPSGSCNFSKIPTFLIIINLINLELINNIFNEDTIKTYINNFNKKFRLVVEARNFNILRIIGGIAGTAYTY